MHKQIIVSIVILYTAFVLGNTSNHIPNDLDKIVKEVSGNINIPGLNGTNLDDINTEQIVQGAVTQLKEKCMNVTKGNENAYTNLVEEAKSFGECIGNLVNVTQLQFEIEAYSKNGSLETVFNKYCLRRVIAKECLHRLANVSEPCLEPNEIKQKNIAVNVIEEMLEFVCYKDGDHIALFIAEDGVKCFSERQEGIQKCVETFSKNYMKEDNTPKMNTNDFDCEDIQPLKVCVVAELEKCENTTPGNLIDAMFKTINKQCKIKLRELNGETSQMTGSPGAGPLTKPIHSLILAIGTFTIAYSLKNLV